MDATLKRITDFTCALDYGDLPAATVHECKRRVLDTLACALGGFAAPPSRIARAIAGRATSKRPARIIGTLEASTPELAAFANGVMMRYLDLNDATGSGGGHPSDMFAALFAAADATRTDGKTFIAAAVAAYELYLGFFRTIQIRDRGWDHVVYTALGSAAGAAKIMGLDRAQTANALALSLTPNMALEVARRGELSMWKGCAGGNAARNALFAAQLAQEGMTGPGIVFEGENGVMTVVGQFEWPPLGEKARPYRLGDSRLKLYPCVYPGQSPVEATLAIRSQMDARDIEAIEVRTYRSAWYEAGSEPIKWTPTTRETADHSIPYLVCAALLDGKIDAASFAPERIADPALRALMQKLRVVHDPELDPLQPEKNPCRLTITLKNGAKKLSSVDYAKGHAMNPPSDQELEAKLAGLNNGVLSSAQLTELKDLCWRLETIDDVGALISATRMNQA
ncbi:MAG: MmgE/PrpD family protein [Burkholderiales bacterium]|nr:MmgE/PrpD family protein [Burkholderiales bacterium]